MKKRIKANHSPRQKVQFNNHLRKATNLYAATARMPSRRKDLLRQATREARTALLLRPLNYEALVLLGDIYADIDDSASNQRALCQYNAAIGVSPNEPDAYDSKSGLIMYGFHRPAEAESLSRRAVALSLKNGECAQILALHYTTLIGILEDRKKFAAARQTIRQALKRCPSEFMNGLVENTLRRINTTKKEQNTRRP